MSREEAISKAITIIAYFRQNFAKSQEAVKNANEIIEVLEQEPCEDCISRQAAIDAIEEDKRNGNDSCFASNYDAQCFKQIIKELPSVKPEQKWIPVSERLPEFTINKVGTQFTEDVLVYDGADLRVGYFARKDKLDCDYWVVYGDDYFEPIAWMPLPEPYKVSPTEAERSDKE